MTITKIPLTHQQHIFSFLDERDLHFAWLTCKDLQRDAGDNRLWKPFLTKRHIEPTENNKQRLTAFFRKSCEFLRAHYSDPVIRTYISEELRSQKSAQLHMDSQQTVEGNIVISKARWKEMHSSYRDIYDQYAAIFHCCVIRKPPLFKCEHLNRSLYYISRSADSDEMRFHLDLGANPSQSAFPSKFENKFVLDRLLRTGRASLETVKLLLAYKAGFTESRVVMSNGNVRIFNATIDIAARWSSPEVFCFLWNLHPVVSEGGESPHLGTLGSALVNASLIREPEIIKMLLQAGAKIDEDRISIHLLRARSWGAWANGNINIALSNSSCTVDAIRVLIEAGTRPTQRGPIPPRGIRRRAGSLDAAVTFRQPPEILQLLLDHGARLSRGDEEGDEALPGTLEIARQHNLPPESIQLLEEAAKVQFATEEQIPPLEIEQVNEIPSPQDEPPLEVAIADAPVRDPLPLPDINPQDPLDADAEEPDLASLVQQVLPSWLWNALVAIDRCISSIVVAIINCFRSRED